MAMMTGERTVREGSKDSLIRKGDMDLRNAVMSLTQAQSSMFLYAIQHNISDVLEKFEDFKREMHNINKASSDIQDISKKTKMLSLNASIEAARAGNAGRGFKVVAEEIGHLSNQTTHCTDEVNRINSNMLGNAAANQGALRELSGCVTKFSDSKAEAGMLKLTVIEENGFIITTLAKQIENHAGFMRNILKNAGTLTQVNDHHTCAFGKWYDQNRETYRHIPGFEAIYEVHESFHKTAITYNETMDIRVLVDFLGLSNAILSAFLVLAESFKREVLSGENCASVGEAA